MTVTFSVPLYPDAAAIEAACAQVSTPVGSTGVSGVPGLSGVSGLETVSLSVISRPVS